MESQVPQGSIYPIGTRFHIPDFSLIYGSPGDKASTPLPAPPCSRGQHPPLSTQVSLRETGSEPLGLGPSSSVKSGNSPACLPAKQWEVRKSLRPVFIPVPGPRHAGNLSRQPRLPSHSPCTGNRLPGLTRQGGKRTLQRPKKLRGGAGPRCPILGSLVLLAHPRLERCAPRQSNLGKVIILVRSLLIRAHGNPQQASALAGLGVREQCRNSQTKT